MIFGQTPWQPSDNLQIQASMRVKRTILDDQSDNFSVDIQFTLPSPRPKQSPARVLDKSPNPQVTLSQGSSISL
jgi:hypothetical protein